MSDEAIAEDLLEQPEDSDYVHPFQATLSEELEARIPRMSTRYFAATIDNVLVVFAFLFVGATLGESFGKHQSETLTITLGIGLYALLLLYFFIPEWLLSTTPGKYWMGLQVVMLDEAPCTFKAALIRTLWRVIEANPLTWLPASVMIFLTPHGRRIGDYHAGTIVVLR